MKSVKNLLSIALITVLFSEQLQASCVILLHGLARTSSAMQTMADQLEATGYQTINVDYPSREFDIERLAPLAIEPALQECVKDTDINIVTHSMGGILVRQYLSQATIKNLYRVVMLGPPNQGSEVVDKLKNIPGFGLLNGEAGLQLGRKPDSLPNRLGAANFNVGIIAGTRTFNPLLSLLIPGDDDGKVAIESTKLKGMKDHITLPVTHTFMMRNEAVIEQVIHYLKLGAFKR